MKERSENDKEQLEAAAFANHAIRVSEHYDEYVVVALKDGMMMWKASDHPFAIRALASVVNSISETMIAKDEALTAKYESLQDPEKEDGIED